MAGAFTGGISWSKYPSSIRILVQGALNAGSEEEKLSKDGVKKVVVEVIVGLLKDRVDIGQRP